MASTVTERAWCVVVPHHPRGARIARQRITGALRNAVGAELLADASAVVAELIGNAIRHAAPLPGGVVQVSWRMLAAGGVEIRVTDGGSSGVPRLVDAGPDALTGRGLTIVAALARRWGSEPDGIGQCVWAELR